METNDEYRKAAMMLLSEVDRRISKASKPLAEAKELRGMISEIETIMHEAGNFMDTDNLSGMIDFLIRKLKNDEYESAR